MYIKFILTVLCFAAYITAFAQPAVTTQRSYGGNKFDQSVSLTKLADGGYLMGSTSVSNTSGEKSEDSRGGEDFWIIRLNNVGVKIFDKTFGGIGVDQIRTVIELASGDLIICGSSFSPVSGDKTAPVFGSFDYWIIRTDALGNMVWNKTYGGSGYDELYGAVTTTDGNILLAGHSSSDISGNKTALLKGMMDYWIVKINLNGDILWDKSYGTTTADFLTDIVPTPGGGAILGGHSDGAAEYDKTQNARGGFDCWIVKIDANGSKTWDKTMGGSANDQLQKLIPTADSGLLVAASSESDASGEKTAHSRGTWDAWVIKLNSSGTIIWNRTFGGAGEDFARNITQGSDGNILVACYSSSGISGEKTEASKGGFDYWILKLESTGVLTWDKTVGGNREDYATNLLLLPNDQYVVIGTSASGISGDKTTITRGNVDIWSIVLGESPYKNKIELKGKYPAIYSKE